MKKLWIYFLMIGTFAVITILGLFTIRLLSGPEDLWICDQGVWIKHGQPRGPKPNRLCTTTSTILNFNKIGNLTRDTNNAWNLVYEEPGAPALSIQLGLSQDCQVTKDKINCNNYDFKVGDRVNAIGIVKNDYLGNFNLVPLKD